MNEDEKKKFMDKHFKAGDYMAMTIFVNKAQVSEFIEFLKLSNMNLAILPGVEAKALYESEDQGGYIYNEYEV